MVISDQKTLFLVKMGAQTGPGLKFWVQSLLTTGYWPIVPIFKILEFFMGI